MVARPQCCSFLPDWKAPGGPDVARILATPTVGRGHISNAFDSAPRSEVGASPVVVLDGEQRAALAVVRSVGRGGHTVHVGASVLRSLAGGSRYATSETLLPDPMGSTAAYAKAVQLLVAGTRARVVLPVTEASTLALLEHPDVLAGVRVPTSDLARFRRACDKAAVLSLANSLGISTPAEWVHDPRAGIAPERFPVVVKPTRSLAGPAGARRKAGVAYADSAAELNDLVARARAEGDRILVQSRIRGPGIGIFLLRWNDEIVASFAHRRLREKPPSGGVSVRCESIEAPEELLDQATALLEALDWHGVAMVEFKQDASTGRHYLMEVNPRFWGSLQLAIDAGVDFPEYLVKLSEGVRIPPRHSWRVGCRSRWALGEVDHLIARLRRSRTRLHLPPESESLARVLVSVLLPWRRNMRGDVFRFSDPVPALREASVWLRELAGVR